MASKNNPIVPHFSPTQNPTDPPIQYQQYQKMLRLNEAKRLILLHKTTITQIALQVAYESPSQFSREHKRWFASLVKSLFMPYLCHIYAIFCHVVLGVCYNGGFINIARISFMLIANPS